MRFVKKKKTKISVTKKFIAILISSIVSTTTAFAKGPGFTVEAEKDGSDQYQQGSSSSGGQNELKVLTTTEADNLLSNSNYLTYEDGFINLRIPECYSRIDDFAFSGYVSLLRVSIPQTVTSIGKNAFEFCSNLVEVTIPSSVTNIGEYAFQENTNLKVIQIPRGLTKIGKCAFFKCFNLKRVDFENVGLEELEIGGFAFANSGIEQIFIPNRVKKIRKRTFAGCLKLDNVRIPSSITEIGDNAFDRCENLKRVDFSKSNNPLVIANEPDLVIRKKAFASIGVEEIEIPDRTVYIESEAFWGCESLMRVLLHGNSTGTNILIIGKGAFAHCDSINMFYAENNGGKKLVHIES